MWWFIAAVIFLAWGGLGAVLILAVILGIGFLLGLFVDQTKKMFKD